MTPTTDVRTGDGTGNYANPVVGTYGLGTLGILTSADTLTTRLFLLTPSNSTFEGASYSNSLDANGLDVEIDGMTVPAVAAGAPEPSSWAMMAAVEGLLLGVKRLRRQRNA